ncbi:MAG TPA: hypothetical protein VFU45_07335 [Gemmatimonadales bacterium]|nr:hypothetical protein [Gemmatimonadales bacterium]
MRARMFLAGAAVLLLAACEPDYGKEQSHPATVESEDAVTGGADPTAMSGRVKKPGEANIQHPRADGNAGRPPDGPGAPASSADSTHASGGA